MAVEGVDGIGQRLAHHVGPVPAVMHILQLVRQQHALRQNVIVGWVRQTVAALCWRWCNPAARAAAATPGKAVATERNHMRISVRKAELGHQCTKGRSRTCSNRLLCVGRK